MPAVDGRSRRSLTPVRGGATAVSVPFWRGGGGGGGGGGARARKDRAKILTQEYGQSGIVAPGFSSAVNCEKNLHMRGAFR